MRLFVLLLAALVAQPALAAPKKKKPAASAKKAHKAAPKAAPTPEPAPEPKPVEKKSSVLLDTNPPAVAAQLEQALAEAFTVGVADTALPEDVDHDAVVKAAKKSRAVAVVTARYANGVWQLRTWSGADGGVLAEATFKGPREGRVVLPKATLAKLLSAAMKAEAAQAEATSEDVASAGTEKPAPEKKPSESPKKKEPPAKQREPEPVKEVVEATPAPASADDSEKAQALHVGVGVRMATRRLFYNDDLFGALSRYNSPLAPSIAIEAELFPGAFFSNGAASYFGLTGSVDFLVGVTAVAIDGTRFSTSALRVKANLMGRIPIAGRLEIGILFGYALTTYAVAGDPALKPNVPDVAYSALRPGASLAVRMIGPLYVKVSGGYQILLNTGQLGSAEFFPRQTGGGLDVQGGLMLRPIRFLEARATFDYQRYWFSMNPEPGDPYIAGGAVDDAIGFTATVAFTL